MGPYSTELPKYVFNLFCLLMSAKGNINRHFIYSDEQDFFPQQTGYKKMPCIFVISNMFQ